MVNEFCEGPSLFGFFLPDKNSFRVKAELLVQDRIGEFRHKGFVTINRAAGDYFDISIHAEGLLPFFPMIRQVAAKRNYQEG